jgi:predicted phage-related endonuclease
MPAIARQILRADADGTPEWLAQRTQGFGGSNAAELHLGLTSRFQMWREKTGHAEPEQVSPQLQALFDYGHSREPELARIFTERTGLRTRNTGTWARKDHDWMLANPDRLVGSDGLLEIKTTGAYTDAADDWRHDRVNPRAWVQANWYAHVTGRTRLYFIAEVDRVPYIYGPLDRDDDLIAELEAEAIEFWGLVTAGEQPAPSTASDMPLAYPTATEGKTVEVDPWGDTALDIDRIRDLDRQIKELQGERKHLVTGIQGEMGDAEALNVGGRPWITWKSQTRAGTVDTKAMAKDGIDIDAYRKPSKTTRTFLVKEA